MMEAARARSTRACTSGGMRTEGHASARTWMVRRCCTRRAPVATRTGGAKGARGSSAPHAPRAYSNQDFDFSGEGLPTDVMETLTPEELAESEQKIDDFMRRCGQEEGELGVGVLLERRRPPPVSQDSVEMLAMVEDVRTKVKRIHEYQDMTVGEIRLTIGVDSPEERELREDLDEDDPKSVSPDELVVVFMEIMDGAPISDELALRVLSQTMKEWPEPDAGAVTADDAESGDAGAAAGDGGKKLKDSIVGWIPLYAVSAVPVLIGVSVVAILFANSLK